MRRQRKCVSVWTRLSATMMALTLLSGCAGLGVFGKISPPTDNREAAAICTAWNENRPDARASDDPVTVTHVADNLIALQAACLEYL